MWPHHIMVGVGDTAISVGTDASEVVDLLEPWRIDESAELVDYGLTLHPPSAEGRRAVRVLPHLQHGSEVWARSRDTTTLVDALLRILGRFDQVVEPGKVRLALSPLTRSGSALLAPPSRVGVLSERRLATHGIDRILCPTSIVDLESCTLSVDPLLGRPETRVAMPMLGWWLASYHPELGLTPANAVAYAMAVCERTAEDNVARIFADLIDFVERKPPQLAPLPDPEFVEALDKALP